MNCVQQAAATGSIIGRMAEPGSELATLATSGWLTGRSGLGNLLNVDYEAMPLMRLYRTSNLLVKHRQAIELLLFSRIIEFFSLPATVTLYELTNTYFEGEMAGHGKARQGHSKEKRADCPLVTLGLVLDGSVFVRHSPMFEGNAVESAPSQRCSPGWRLRRGPWSLWAGGNAAITERSRFPGKLDDTSPHFFAGQRLVTATFGQKDGRTPHVRKTAVAEPKLRHCHNSHSPRVRSRTPEAVK